MATIMEQLENDHRNVAMMMKVLEKQLDLMHEMDNADFELMHGVMHYMTHYPDRVHHPMEDLMFERMDTDDPAVREAIEGLRREHVGLLEKGRAFRDTLRGVVDGALVERDKLEAQGRDYVAFMRHHMRREDTEVFPAAAGSLDETDWEAVAAAFAEQQDPLFGPIVADHYRALLDYIRENAPRSAEVGGGEG